MTLGCPKSPGVVPPASSGDRFGVRKRERDRFSAAVVEEQGERRSRIELELKTGNFPTEKRHAERVTGNLVAHSLIVFFSGLFPVPQLKHDQEDAPHLFSRFPARFHPAPRDSATILERQ